MGTMALFRAEFIHGLVGILILVPMTIGQFVALGLAVRYASEPPPDRA
jgi:hypothetical protein